jgi:hypothetical protein
VGAGQFDPQPDVNPVVGRARLEATGVSESRRNCDGPPKGELGTDIGPEIVAVQFRGDAVVLPIECALPPTCPKHRAGRPSLRNQGRRHQMP